MPELISKPQLRRLQTLYAASISRELGADSSRETRLAWASRSTGRMISSFTELTRAEANTLIDALQTALGQAFDLPSRRRIRDRDLAYAAGTEGRHGRNSTIATMASSEDLARIEQAVSRLGWTPEQFDAWLRSPSSPLGNRPSPAIRTLADANRVWCALKKMLTRAGLWVPAAS